jgi:predicted nucleic-acid-binding protein
MRAVDTNVVVRLVVRDEATQVLAAEEFIARGAWVSHLVLAETVWLLDAVYDLAAEQIALAVDMLLNHRQLAVQDPDVVTSALERFREHPRAGFSDCLIVETARKSGHLPMGTFDRDLAKLDGVKRIR